MNLRELLSHEQQLLSRMAHHKTVRSTQVRSLGLQFLSRHLTDHGSLSVDHLVVREHKNKIFAVCVKHAEGQFSVMVLSEIGIALHVSRKIIHPAHVPFIIEAQGAFLDIAGDLRPCSRLLSDQDGSVCPSFKYRIQMF